MQCKKNCRVRFNKFMFNESVGFDPYEEIDPFGIYSGKSKDR